MISAREDGREAGGVRTLDRALDLLQALEAAGHPLELGELGRATNLPKCTALRLLAALERRGLIEKEQGRYHLGVGIVPLARGYLSRSSLTSASLPVLEELALLSGETVALWVRHGFERVVVQRVDSPHPVLFATRIGQRLPLHVGASGLVLAAALEGEELQQLLDRVGEIVYATGERVGREQFLSMLEQVRRQGFAVSVSQRVTDVVSVAAPVVRRKRGTIAAISASGPPSRMTPEKTEYLTISIRRAAQEVSEAYGYS